MYPLLRWLDVGGAAAVYLLAPAPAAGPWRQHTSSSPLSSPHCMDQLRSTAQHATGAHNSVLVDRYLDSFRYLDRNELGVTVSGVKG